jgi:hypothetical protein
MEGNSPCRFGSRNEHHNCQAALAESRGRVSGPKGAAAKLRIPPSSLEFKIKKLKIAKSHFKTLSVFFLSTGENRDSCEFDEIRSSDRLSSHSVSIAWEWFLACNVGKVLIQAVPGKCFAS